MTPKHKDKAQLKHSQISQESHFIELQVATCTQAGITISLGHLDYFTTNSFYQTVQRMIRWFRLGIIKTTDFF